jgi:hypothetical protein
MIHKRCSLKFVLIFHSIWSAAPKEAVFLEQGSKLSESRR